MATTDLPCCCSESPGAPSQAMGTVEGLAVQVWRPGEMHGACARPINRAVVHVADRGLSPQAARGLAALLVAGAQEAERLDREGATRG